MGGPLEDVIDISRLNEVSMGDQEFERVLLQAYLEDADVQVDAIDAAIGKGAFTALQAAAHSLKGASANLGMREAHNISAALERMNPAEDPEGAKILLRQLHVELDRIKAFIAQHLGE